MKLIIIYGPPAVGKLTVGEELSKLTGIKLFHNHMTFDLGEALFEAFSPGHLKVVDGMRLVVFETAAEHGLDLIFTLVYAHREDDPYVEHFAEIVERHGGEVCFVRLHAPASVLEERVVLEDRQRFRKLKSAETLRRLMERYMLLEQVPDRESLSLDTSELSPADAARRIAEHFGLTVTGPQT
jgi:broad-specificity NMP kinase